MKHKKRPAEPWGKQGEIGLLDRVAPGANSAPAQAFVIWGDMEYTTWENLTDLLPLEFEDDTRAQQS